MICSVEGCGNEAIVSLTFRGQIGHAHVCAADEATDREWCDVVYSTRILNGECFEAVCTPYGIYVAEPTPLR